ncbi:peptide methionine sulfoxide reductase MsrB-like, partial [Oppia nitens]|uniref:peptide methionine sulfoxide reductase MsrB-like n=1 Tax=Oppia nitens TaxID=1686743 RepID=UPI0023DA6208
MQNNHQSSSPTNSMLSKEERDELVKHLTPLQVRVTQHKITERPFTGEYLKLNDDGLYCCVVCGEPIFSSQSKYDSGCGWPAFDGVINNSKVKLNIDLSHVGSNLLLLAVKSDVARTEVSCARCASHLGHVFDDGPAKTTGKRFCINSSALKFFNTDSDVTDSVPPPMMTTAANNGHHFDDTINEKNKLSSQRISSPIMTTTTTKITPAPPKTITTNNSNNKNLNNNNNNN